MVSRYPDHWQFYGDCYIISLFFQQKIFIFIFYAYDDSIGGLLFMVLTLSSAEVLYEHCLYRELQPAIWKSYVILLFVTNEFAMF